MPDGTHRKTLIVILGPTASGKTGMAINLALALHTHILSADSRQFYRELKIGSAMPAPDELARVPHHFVGHLSVNDYYNVSRFQNDALNCLSDLFRQHDYVVMCGGSGLYIDAVCSGMDALPDPDEELRKELRNELKEHGLEALQNKLRQLDPEHYRQVDLKNHTRLIRALEVCLLTGKPYSSLRTGKAQPRGFDVVKTGMNTPPNELLERIVKRTEVMFAAGLEEEARALFPLRHLNALKTVGYTELFDYFEGKYTLDEAKQKIIINTRRYAKRQLTWFRRTGAVHWLHQPHTETILKLLPDGK